MRTWSLRIDDHAIIDSFVQRSFASVSRNQEEFDHVSDAQDASGK